MVNMASRVRYAVIVLCMLMLGALSSIEGYAATRNDADGPTAPDRSNEPKDQVLQKIFDDIDAKFSNLRTDLSMNYFSSDNNYDSISYVYKLTGRNGCTIAIEDSVDAKHTEKYTDTGMTKSFINDVYNSSITIQMSKIHTINITHPGIDSPYPLIFSYNPDILKNCVNINFTAIDNDYPFKAVQNKHICQYIDSEHHQDNKYVIEETPIEISNSLSTYSICVSDERLAEFLVRAFNEYRGICEERMAK